MKPWLKLTLAWPLLSGLATGIQARPLTISAPDWPPFYIQSQSQTAAKGLAWDIISTCTRGIDASPLYEEFPIRRMFRYMESGELDLNIMSYKADREKSVQYGRQVVFENSYGIWARADFRGKIRSLQDLSDLSIAQLIGLRPSDQFKAILEARLKSAAENPDQPKDTLIVNDPDQIIKMLAAGHVDATVASIAEITWRARHLGLMDKIKFTGVTVQRQKYYFVLSRTSPYVKARPDLMRRLDQCVNELRAGGYLDSLRKSYGL